MTIFRRYNKPEIAILALAAFLFLAKYSWNQPQDYTHQQVDSISRLLEKVSKPQTMTEVNARKMVYLYGN